MDFEHLWFDNESFSTETSKEQCSCEKSCADFLQSLLKYDEETIERLKSNGVVNYEMEMRLVKSKHVAYLMHNLEATLPSGFVHLDASRPWIMYWIIHPLYLLGREVPEPLAQRVISTLSHIQSPTGGYGGGPMQLSHGAPNYAAVLALCTIGSDAALSSINRAAMYNLFLSLKHPSGGFRIHHDGEVDSRGTYTIVAIARLLNILTPELSAGTADYLLSCQTYEGGFGGEPGNEAHGGYNFCAVAALLILNAAQRIDVNALESWLLRKQVRLEGGFQGRTNKLVDSCYSFWQGGALALVDIIRRGGSDTYDLDRYLELEARRNVLQRTGDLEDVEVIDSDLERHFQVHGASRFRGALSFDQLALQRYVLHCAQNVDHGGLKDKPGKMRDFYHSCYALSGLAVAQSSISCALWDPNESAMQRAMQTEEEEEEDVDEMLPTVDFEYNGPQVYGDLDNLLQPTSVVFNIGLPKLRRALEYFGAMTCDHETLLAEYRSQR